MDQALLTPLNQLESSLNSLLTSLTNTNTYNAAPAATQSLLNADDALSSSLVQLRQHQDNYTRILTLRAEADRLQTQLRDIVRTCVDLRTEIGQIQPSILEDTSSDDGDDAPVKKEIKPVDYNTLLSFAARIGKHNAAAAIEAEHQSNRRPPSTSKPQEANGSSEDQPSNNNTTQESLAELAAINDTLAQQRAYRGMAFPAAEALRMGALGRLQYLREQEGEDAVEREIERMIRDSERVIPSQTSQDVGGSETAKKEEQETESKKASGLPALLPPPGPSAPQQQQQQLPPRPQLPLPPKPKVQLDLDFPSSDEDDD